MNVLKKLEGLKPNKPYNGFANLTVGFHSVECFRTVKNKFGKKGDGSNKSILIELANEVLFLPQYFWQKLKEDDLHEMNTAIGNGEQIYLYFGGRQEKNE